MRSHISGHCKHIVICRNVIFFWTHWYNIYIYVSFVDVCIYIYISLIIFKHMSNSMTYHVTFVTAMSGWKSHMFWPSSLMSRWTFLRLDPSKKTHVSIFQVKKSWKCRSEQAHLFPSLVGKKKNPLGLHPGPKKMPKFQLRIQPLLYCWTWNFQTWGWFVPEISGTLGNNILIYII